MVTVDFYRFRARKALHTLDKVLKYPCARRLCSGERCSLILTGKQQYLLTPTIHFLQNENLVYMSGFDEDREVDLPAWISLRAIPLPKLLHLFSP